MQIFDDEMTLPGVITQVEADYSYGFDTTLWGTTESVLIIGTAFNGPTSVPTPVYSPEHAAYVFGEAYDSKTRQEATLVAGVQDAWNRGCRTIYACRIGGKDLYKDYDFRIETPYKLRVSSMFPTNKGKDCYVLYNNAAGEESITFYKPSSMATIAEKKRGLVKSAGSVMKTTLKLNLDYGMSSDDRLVDLINTFNTHTYNTAIKLSIVNKDGIDVTNSPEVYGLSIGALYPGVYFIGRDATNSACTIETCNDFELVNASGSNKPYPSFTDSYFRTLKFNTDVTQSVPVYAETVMKMREALQGAGLTVAKEWDFLETADLADRAFIKDSEDYEETQLSNFEIYKRLGSGFATTAHAISRGKDENNNERVPRIKESEPADKNHVVPIEDGIYSVLQDADIKYRVLTCVNADDTINGKLPRANEFKIVSANSINALGGYITITPAIDSKDFSKARKYTFEFSSLDNTTVPTKDQIDTTKIYPVITKFVDSSAEKDKPFDLKEINKKGIDKFKQGELILVEGAAGASTKKYYVLKDGDSTTHHYFMLDSDGNETSTPVTSADSTLFDEVDGPAGALTLYRRTGDKLVKIDKTAEGYGYIAGDVLYVADASGVLSKKDLTGVNYILGDTLDKIFVYKVDGDKLVNIGGLNEILTEAEDRELVVSAENGAYEDNKITVKSPMLDAYTLEEFVDKLNNHDVFGKLFKVELTIEGKLHKDEFVIDGSESMVAKDAADSLKIDADRTETYDYNLYIPYRTTDNFLRQLAQHCTYTELKTTPTFGFMGCKRLINTGLASVASKVSSVSEKDFDLYAKNNYGRNMLDANEQPYPIGKNVNLILAQYPVSMNNGSYTYTSNAAAGYAGMVSALALDQSSTGQHIEVNNVDFTLSQTQLGKLTNAGIVTIRKSFTKGFTITDGITMAPAESVYRRLSSSRIVGACEDLIRAAAEPFIGKENHTANRNALQTAIKSSMDKIVGTLIEDYSFQLNNDTKIQKFNYIEINYQIIPIYEIREIRNTIKIVDSITTTSESVSA